MTEPDISLVIVTWNCRDAIADCLRSLAANPPSHRWEVIVVDNASRDDTVDAVRRVAPEARVIANPDNRGLAAANNQGMLAARGQFIVISNPDVVYRPGALDALHDLLRRRPRAAFATARLVHPDGRPQASAGDLPTVRDALLGRQFGRARAVSAQATNGMWWDTWAHDEERTVDHGAEACYMVRRAALAEIGPQDERFWLDWEGFDWAARVREAGWEVWFCPDAVVVHTSGESIRQAQLRWVVASHRGMYRYFAKRHGPAVRPALAVAVTARGALKAAVVLAGVPMYDLAHRRDRRASQGRS